MAIVIPTDRPKSVRNRCITEVLVFSGVWVLSSYFFCGCRALVIELSQFSSFYTIWKCCQDHCVLLSFITLTSSSTDRAVKEVTACIGWQRIHHCHPVLTRQKHSICFTWVGHLTELVFL